MLATQERETPRIDMAKIHDAETINKEFTPYVPTTQSPPEFTFYAFLLGILLATLFNAANAYLGLKIGLTISASIPSAVISMATLRILMPRLLGRHGTILENNIVHAIASTGEAVAGAVIFTVPAILFLGGQFTNATVFWLGMVGGVIGLLMMIPLRHSLCVKEHRVLPFPEGTACSEVLIAGDKGGATAKPVFTGIGIGAAFKFAMSGLNLFRDVLFWDFPALHKAGFGYEVSPLLAGVGYLVGLPIAATMLAGGLMGYWVLIPMIDAFGRSSVIAPATIPVSAMTTAQIRLEYVRYIGAGGVAFGGLLSLLRSLPDIVSSLRHSLKALAMVRRAGEEGEGARPPEKDKEQADIVKSGAVFGLLIAALGTEFPWSLGPADLPGSVRLLIGIAAHFVLAGGAGALAGAVLFNYLAHGASKLSRVFPRVEHDLSLGVVAGGSLLMMAIMWLLPVFGLSFVEILIVVAFSFFFVAVSSRIVGIVGTTNQPLSGMTITALLGMTLLFVALGHSAGTVKTAAIMGGAVACIAMSLSGDLSQDLKSAALLGATPWKVQIAQIMGTLASAVRSGFILLILYAAYGFGAPTAGHPHPLEAPQAQLMAKLIEGVTGGNLPWTMLILGAGIGLVVELCGVSALAFSLGLYLPISNWPMIMVGGLVHWWSHRKRSMSAAEEYEDKGSLFASGLIAGDSLTGIAIAGITVLGLDRHFTLRNPDAGGAFFESALSTALYVPIVWLLARYATSRRKTAHA